MHAYYFTVGQLHYENILIEYTQYFGVDFATKVDT